MTRSRLNSHGIGFSPCVGWHVTPGALRGIWDWGRAVAAWPVAAWLAACWLTCFHSHPHAVSVVSCLTIPSLSSSSPPALFCVALSISGSHILCVDCAGFARRRTALSRADIARRSHRVPPLHATYFTASTCCTVDAHIHQHPLCQSSTLAGHFSLPCDGLMPTSRYDRATSRHCMPTFSRRQHAALSTRNIC